MLAAALLALAQVTAVPTPVRPERVEGPSSPSPTPHLVTHARVFPLPDNAVAYVPASAGLHPPLLVLLHGAGHHQLEMVEHFEPEADSRGVVLLAPSSRGGTWDAVEDAEGIPDTDSPLAGKLAHRFSGSRDARRVDSAIANLEKIVPVDPGRIVLAGFSDGATFALAMGLSRDQSFAAVIAWSPGIAIRTDSPARGRRVFVSHGRQDPLLKFSVTCADIVPMLEDEGAAVTFLPFDGGHEAPVWLKDTFLDAVFGRRAGSEARPLPAEEERCVGGRADVPAVGG